MSNIPKLRFPEFNGEWEEKRFGDILSLNMVPVPKPDTEYERLGIFCHNKGTFHEHITDPSYIALDTLYKVHKNNFIVNITFAWEHAIAITTQNDEDALVTFRFLMFSFNKGYYHQFFKYAFSKEKFRYDLNVASPGGAGRNRVLNQKQLNNINLIVPSISEQEKIADFLSNVDSIITAETKILKKLQKKKKALMQKLFTQQLRFKSNDGTDFPAWEERKLGDVCSYIGGGTPSKKVKEYWNGNINWASVKDITGKYLYETQDKISQLGADSSATNICEPDSLLLITRMSPGKTVITKCITAINQDLKIVNSDINVEFLHLLFQSIQTKIDEKTSGTTVKGISIEGLNQIDIRLPCKAEQQKITACLSSLDSLIQNQQKVVTTWQQRKKALLQQMFI